MLGNAVLEIEHDTQAIYYLCVLNLGYRIVCPTISFRRWALDTSMHFSLHVDCGNPQKQIKASAKDEEKMMYVSTSPERMSRVTPNDAEMLSNVTQSRRYAVIVILLYIFYHALVWYSQVMIFNLDSFKLLFSSVFLLNEQSFKFSF